MLQSIINFTRGIFDFSVFGLIFDQFINAKDQVIVRSNDEEIDELLKDKKDRLTFHETVEELKKNGEQSKEVDLSGHRVVISI